MSEPTCMQCGGLHFGSNGCPYAETICDVCDKTLLRHEGYAFCAGGQTKHNPAQKYCTCLTCVQERTRVSRELKPKSEYARGYAAGSADMREKAAELVETRIIDYGNVTLRQALASAVRSLPGSPKEEK